MTWSGDSSAQVAKQLFLGHRQQANSDVVENLGLAFTKTFAIWCAVNTDIQEGDTISDGLDTYSVKAITFHMCVHSKKGN